MNPGGFLVAWAKLACVRLDFLSFVTKRILTRTPAPGGPAFLFSVALHLNAHDLLSCLLPLKIFGVHVVAHLCNFLLQMKTPREAQRDGVT